MAYCIHAIFYAVTRTISPEHFTEGSVSSLCSDREIFSLYMGEQAGNSIMYLQLLTRVPGWEDDQNMYVSARCKG